MPEHDVVRAINMLKKKDREMTKATFKIKTYSFGKEYIELTHNEFTKTIGVMTVMRFIRDVTLMTLQMCPVTSLKIYIQT